MIGQYRDATSANLRTQLHRMIKRAGLVPRPKVFQNLRSSRETELAEDHRMHVVCRWIGNIQPVAMQHYLQVTDEHFARALQKNGTAPVAQKATQNPTQQIAEPARNGPQSTPPPHP